jgi:hypothetical protein
VQKLVEVKRKSRQAGLLRFLKNVGTRLALNVRFRLYCHDLQVVDKKNLRHPQGFSPI